MIEEGILITVDYETSSEDEWSSSPSSSSNYDSEVENSLFDYCWVCDKEDVPDKLIRPCKCEFTRVHESCLLFWIDCAQKVMNTTLDRCPSCKTKYIYAFSDLSQFAHFLEVVDKNISKVCTIAAGTLFGISIYWTSVLHGAVTVLQILGYQEGIKAMKEVPPLFLFLTLPSLPLMLIFGKLVNWEDSLLKLWRKYRNRIPLLIKLLGHSADSKLQGVFARPAPEVPCIRNPIYAHQSLFGVILLPTMATMFGHVFFRHVSNNPWRILLGGVTFTAVKGILKVYLYQQRYNQQCKRKALNYNAPGK